MKFMQVHWEYVDHDTASFKDMLYVQITNQQIWRAFTVPLKGITVCEKAKENSSKSQDLKSEDHCALKSIKWV